jgi:hypothetical protein
MISHALSAGIFPAGVVEPIDRGMRTFLWTREHTYSRGKCKVSWLDVCQPKALDGMGVLSIPVQNSVLLSKFLTKLHSSDAPWAAWFRRAMVGHPDVT